MQNSQLMKNELDSPRRWFWTGVLNGMTAYVPSASPEDMLDDIQRQLPPEVASRLRRPKTTSAPTNSIPFYHSTTEALARHWRAVGDSIEAVYVQERQRQG